MIKLNKILLVEDNTHDVELIVETLMEYQIVNEIEVVTDGAEALDFLYHRDKFNARPAINPDLIILDLKLPKVDGIEVLKSIKGDPKTRSIPVVVFTSSREDRDLNDCYALGVNAYVVKPVGFKEFNEAIRRLGLFWAFTNETPLKSGN